MEYTQRLRAPQGGARRVMTKLEEEGFPARLVGGCIRDALLGLEVHDYDIATVARPEQVLKLFSEGPFKVIPTGLKHGTVTVVYRRIAYEITSLRIDEKTNGRHAVVVYTSSFQQDAARRDFTINALYQDLQGQVYDFFSGKEDLRRGVVRFVGDPETRIREDYLRILRYFRFRSRFGFSGVLEDSRAISKLSGGLSTISKERITSELSRMFAGPLTARLLHDMDKAGLLLLSRLQCGSLKASEKKSLYSKVEGISRRVDGKLLADARFALFLCEFCQQEQRAHAEHPARRFIRSFRFSGKRSAGLIRLSEAVEKLLELSSDQRSLQDFMDFCEAGVAHGSFCHFFYPVLRALFDHDAACSRLLAQMLVLERGSDNRRRVAMPVNGHTIEGWLGGCQGSRTGEVLRELKYLFREHKWTTSREAEKIVQSVFAPTGQGKS